MVEYNVFKLMVLSLNNEYANLVCGVPQGFVLGPLNFCMYNPLGSILRHHGIDYHIYMQMVYNYTLHLICLILLLQ